MNAKCGVVELVYQDLAEDCQFVSHRPASSQITILGSNFWVKYWPLQRQQDLWPLTRGLWFLPWLQMTSSDLSRPLMDLNYLLSHLDFASLPSLPSSHSCSLSSALVTNHKAYIYEALISFLSFPFSVKAVFTQAVVGALDDIVQHTRGAGGGSAGGKLDCCRG